VDFADNVAEALELVKKYSDDFSTLNRK
jgi:hypothetical protein